LSSAETMTGEFDLRLSAGRDVLHRLSLIVSAGRPPHERVAPSNEAKSVAVEVQAFAERLRTKVHGLAA
jgi:hypothetical protein